MKNLKKKFCLGAVAVAAALGTAYAAEIGYVKIEGRRPMVFDTKGNFICDTSYPPEGYELVSYTSSTFVVRNKNGSRYHYVMFDSGCNALKIWEE